MKTIPIAGTAVVNGVHWLERLIDSIDYPIDEFVIFNNNGRGEITQQLEELISRPHQYIKKFNLCHLPRNIGCGGSWNMIIKSYMAAPYWLILSHDVKLGPGLLASMVSKAEDPEVGIVHCNTLGPKLKNGDDATYHLGSFEFFLIKDWVVQEYGLFDENIYPAYCEDVDYMLRIVNKPFKRLITTIPYLHGESDYATSGSQTSRSDPNIQDKLSYAYNMNHHYVLKKWGCFWDDRWENMKPYKTPFNIPDAPLSFTGYDISFCKSKHLGF